MLQLAEREKFDITAISLAQVTAELLGRLRAQEKTDAVALADCVYITARLLLLKSRSLLPSSGTVLPEEPNGEDLAQRLEAFGIYRGAAQQFQERTGTGPRSFPRIVSEGPVLQPPLRKIPLGHLSVLLHDVLSRFAEAEPAVMLPPEIVSVRKKSEHILAAIRCCGSTTFLRLASECASRVEVVVCFLAVLHLLHEGTLLAAQSSAFGDIVLSLSK